MTISIKFAIIYKMIKYNWRRLNNFFDWTEKDVLKYFYWTAKLPYYNGRISKSDIGKIKQLHSYEDNYSFLIGYDKLFTEHSDVKKIYEYIHISSFRNYFDYKKRNIDWINRWQIPESINLNNPLVRVKDDKVYLNYDSSQQEK